MTDALQENMTYEQAHTNLACMLRHVRDYPETSGYFETLTRIAEILDNVGNPVQRFLLAVAEIQDKITEYFPDKDEVRMSVEVDPESGEATLVIEVVLLQALELSHQQLERFGSAWWYEHRVDGVLVMVGNR